MIKKHVILRINLLYNNDDNDTNKTIIVIIGNDNASNCNHNNNLGIWVLFILVDVNCIYFLGSFSWAFTRYLHIQIFKFQHWLFSPLLQFWFKKKKHIQAKALFSLTILLD